MKECFLISKQADDKLDESIERVRLREGREMATYIAISSIRGLISLEQMGTLYAGVGVPRPVSPLAAAGCNELG